MAIKLAAVARPAARHRQQPACQGRRRSSRLPAARPRQGQHRSLPAAPLSAGAGVATPSAARSPLPLRHSRRGREPVKGGELHAAALPGSGVPPVGGAVAAAPGLGLRALGETGAR